MIDIPPPPAGLIYCPQLDDSWAACILGAAEILPHVFVGYNDGRDPSTLAKNITAVRVAGDGEKDLGLNGTLDAIPEGQWVLRLLENERMTSAQYKALMRAIEFGEKANQDGFVVPAVQQLEKDDFIAYSVVKLFKNQKRWRYRGRAFDILQDLRTGRAINSLYKPLAPHSFHTTLLESADPPPGVSHPDWGTEGYHYASECLEDYFSEGRQGQLFQSFFRGSVKDVTQRLIQGGSAGPLLLLFWASDLLPIEAKRERNIEILMRGFGLYRWSLFAHFAVLRWLGLVTRSRDHQEQAKRIMGKAKGKRAIFHGHPFRYGLETLSHIMRIMQEDCRYSGDEWEQDLPLAEIWQNSRGEWHRLGPKEQSGR